MKMKHQRTENLAYARASGHTPYPAGAPVTHSLATVARLEKGENVIIAGRVLAVRAFKTLVFAVLGNATDRVQISFKQTELGDSGLSEFGSLVDDGDILCVEGSKYVTRSGEHTIAVASWRLMAKCLHPLPGKFKGLQDEQLRLRRRYLLTSTSLPAADIFRRRAILKRSLRTELEKNKFIEIDTPTIQLQKSGALARSFSTHHNALGITAELRIAPETWLKRALIGGYDRVYEIATCFRNEGMSTAHWPEFHMLEFYAAYWDFEQLKDFTQALLKKVVKDVVGTTSVTHQGVTLDFSGDWPAVSFRDLLLHHTQLDINDFLTTEELRAEVLRRGLLSGEDVKGLGRGNLIDSVYKKHARSSLIKPTFLIQHPLDVSPLARANDNDPNVVDRLQLVINGWEVVNAYQELADPIEQRRRLEQQAAAASGGDEEALTVDEDFLLALEYGMPPAAGWGMGIERLLALLTDQTNIKDTIMFPISRGVDHA